MAMLSHLLRNQNFPHRICHCVKITRLPLNAQRGRHAKAYRRFSQIFENRNDPYDCFENIAENKVEKPVTAFELLTGSKMKRSCESLNIPQSHPVGTTQESIAPILVVLITWTAAERRHMLKYAQLYLDQGFHVLWVKTSPLSVLLPSFPRIGVQATSRELLRFLVNSPQYRYKLVHGFSIVTAIWGEVIRLSLETLESYAAVRRGLLGQIWDSPAPAPRLFEGLSTAIFPRARALAGITEVGLRGVFQMCPKITIHPLTVAIDTFSQHPVHAPTLLFGCQNDRISHPQFLKEIVQSKIWDRSEHVSHFTLHHREYKDRLQSFLQHTGLKDCHLA